MLKDISDLFVQPVLNVWHIFANYLPNVIAALIFILFAVVLNTDEFVTGIALNLFAVGFPVSLMVGLLVVLMTLPALTGQWDGIFGQATGRLSTLLGAR